MLLAASARRPTDVGRQGKIAHARDCSVVMPPKYSRAPGRLTEAVRPDRSHDSDTFRGSWFAYVRRSLRTSRTSQANQPPPFFRWRHSQGGTGFALAPQSPALES